LSPLPRLGKLLLALGGIGLIRLAPEVLQAQHVSRDFALILTVDAVLAFATAAAGEGLWHGKAWAARLSMRTAGVVLATSIGMGILVVNSLQVPLYAAHPTVWGRLIYYAMAMVLWPYAVRTLIVGAPSDSWRPLLRSFILWLFLGIPLILVVMAILR
jgi:hypothetical protein